jgi:hypothetical protein
MSEEGKQGKEGKEGEKWEKGGGRQEKDENIEGGIEGTCMRGGLKKKGEERGSIHVVACGQALEYSENLGERLVTLRAMCAVLNILYNYMWMKDDAFVSGAGRNVTWPLPSIKTLVSYL